MTDRFRFRAWYKPLFDEESPHYVYDVEQIYDGFTNKGHCELGWVSSFGSLLDSDEYIIEQCTGLKDKNGKLIYEGDILDNISIDEQYEVKWDEDTARFCCITDNEIYDFDNFDVTAFEILGNIHENADLLENEE